MLWQQDTHTGLETLPSVPQEQRSHLSIPLGHLPTSPQLCHNVSMHISLPLSLSPSFSLPATVCLSHHPLFFLSPCRCLTHYFCLLLHLYPSHSYPAPTHAHQPVYASRPPSASSTTIYYFEGNPTCIIFLPINISALISKTGSLNLGAVDIVNQVSLCCEELVLCIAGCFATFLRSLY